MRRKLHPPEIEEPIINLTPLIDVVFVVLIIFIIIAPMLELDRVELASAAPAKQSTAPDSTTFTIHVHQDNTIWFNGKCVTAEQLTKLLKDVKRQGDRRIPQLFQDKRAAFGTYQNVKNAVEIAGFEQLDVILKPN